MAIVLWKTLTFGRLVDVALVVSCLALGYRTFLGPGDAVAPATDRPARYTRGDRIGAIPGVDLAESDRSLLVFVRSTCSFCTESIPFYKALAMNAASHPDRLQMVILSSESKETTTTYLAAHGVMPNAIQVVQRRDARVIATPTIVLVDQAGVVLRVWRGKVPPEVEDAVIDVALAGGS